MRGILVGLLVGTELRCTSSTRVRGKGGRNTTGKLHTSILPSECQHCSGGIVDPFQPTHDYCSQQYDICKCCESALQSEFQRICTSGKDNGGTFMGYGSCVAGIQAAIEQKKEHCEHQQAMDDWNHQQRQEEINDILGGHTLVNSTSGVVSSALHSSTSNSTGYVVHRFDSECASYSDPSCDGMDALCAHGYGCNDQLHDFESDYKTVKDYYGLYQHTPCFR
mmetsp:Transcript_107224/g.299504  ORF Transcript_107224/g.299504 Transcript_107224/m.299504 type:complete len:222 (+) Transcript_107224:75-740(+)